MNGLRTIAFLLVFCQHYLPITFGWVGVEIFFVLSGFLITGILLDSITKEDRLTDFYRRRVLRIFPLYYGVFAILLLLTPLLHLEWNRRYIWWLLHLGNYLRDLLPPTTENFHVEYFAVTTAYPWFWLRLGHFWTLCVEEQFYLIWPLAVFAIARTRRILTVCLVTFALMPFLRELVLKTMPIEVAYGLLQWSMPLHMDSLMVGGALAAWCRLNPGHPWLQSKRRCSLIFVAGCLFLLPWLLIGKTRLMPPDSGVWVFSTLSLAFVAIIFETTREHSLLCQCLSWKPLRKAGQYTYGAYVFHDIPHNLYARMGIALANTLHVRGVLCILPLALGGTAVLSAFSYHFWEQPFLRLKDRPVARS